MITNPDKHKNPEKLTIDDWKEYGKLVAQTIELLQQQKFVPGKSKFVPPLETKDN